MVLFYFFVFRVYGFNIGTSIVAMAQQPPKPLLHPTLEAYPCLTRAMTSTPSAIKS